jgi:hypothetical protein
MGMLLIIGAGVFSLTPMDWSFLYLSTILVLSQSLTKVESYLVLWLSFFAGDLCQFLRSNKEP